MNRINQEKKTITYMIRLYDRKHKLSPSETRQLESYAHARLDGCQYGNAKPTCRKCSTHCYKPDMRGKVRDVMKYAGPRLLFSHPILAVRHLIQEIMS